MAKAEVKCLFCQGISKYSCPQCSARYCSVACYQSETHRECSENFYKQQVMKELKEMKGGDDEKRKLMQMLSKLNRNDEVTTDSTDISERLSNVCLDDVDAVWEMLSEKEKENFQRRIESGNIDFMKIWTPWWKRNKSVKILEVKKEKEKKKNLPKILKDVPHVNDILRHKSPDDNLKYNVMEILLAYVYTSRHFNGDLYDSPEEAVGILCHLSMVLSENRVYSDLETCLFCFIENAEANECSYIDPVSTCFEDLVVILQSIENYVERSLSDLYLFLKRFRKQVGRNAGLSESTNDDIDQSKHLYGLSKKVYFLLAFWQDYGHVIKPMHEAVSEIRAKLLNERKLHKQTKDVVESNMNKLGTDNRKLIEEV